MMNLMLWEHVYVICKYLLKLSVVCSLRFCHYKYMRTFGIVWSPLWISTPQTAALQNDSEQTIICLLNSVVTKSWNARLGSWRVPNQIKFRTFDLIPVFNLQGLLLCPQTLSQTRRARLRRAFTEATGDTVNYVRTVGLNIELCTTTATIDCTISHTY